MYRQALVVQTESMWKCHIPRVCLSPPMFGEMYYSQTLVKDHLDIETVPVYRQASIIQTTIIRNHC